MRKAQDERAWWARNFNYGTLWYSLTKDDREYLYGTRAYYNFYLLVSFYLLLYAIINSWSVIDALSVGSVPWHDPAAAIGTVWHAVWSPETSLLFKTKLPSLALALASCVLIGFCLAEMFEEYTVLFTESGQYVSLARVYQKKEGGIARSIWGRLLLKENKSPVPNVTLCLADAN